MSTGQRVVILGGGFGGAFTAKYLNRYAPANVEVELINDTNYFVFQPLLPEVASGTINAQDAVVPLRVMLKGIKVRMADVTDVDREARQIHIVQGSKRTLLTVPYDHLVIAVGQQTNVGHSPGFSEHSLTMRNLADAHGLRNHLIQCLEHADVTEDANVKRRLLTFVVAGGGFSGVETMGEVTEMIYRTLKFYPNIRPDEIRAVLVQRGPRILPELSQRLGEYAQRKLSRRGVEVRLGASIQSATATAVYLDDADCIETQTLVTTVGNGPRPITESLGIELQRGKILVDEYLQVSGFTQVWSLGYAALIPLSSVEGDDTQYAPPTAQFAVREARCLAKNIVSSLLEKPLKPFAYRPRGALASIGNYRAVAEIFGVRLSGLFAWVLWRGFYIGMLPGFSTRLRVALNWLFDYFLPRSIVQIANKERPAASYRRYARGDVIFRPGQIVDGFYTIVSGGLESRIPDATSDEDFVRILGPGDHWGELSLNAEFETHGTLTAVQDTQVLVLRRADFRNLLAAFPALDNYFRSISEEIYAPSLRAASRKRAEPRRSQEMGHEHR
ncbi:MAG: FAD-dependent oxidoreductase [Gemmatimonadales bacterium]